MRRFLSQSLDTYLHIHIQLVEQSNTKKVFKGLSKQTLVSIGYTACDMLVFSLFSRLLTKEDFGYYAVICAVLIIVQSLSDAGIGSSVVQKQNPDAGYVNTAFTISFIVGLFSTLLLLCLSRPLALLLADASIASPLALVSVVALLYSLNSVANALLLKELSFLRLGTMKIIAYLISAAVGLLMAYLGYGVYSLVVYLIVNWFFFTLFIYLSSHYRPRFIICKAHVKSIVSFGGWLTLGIIVKNLAWQFDKLVLSRWLSVSALGAYYRPSGFIGTFSNQVNGIMDTTLFPILSNIQNERDKLIKAFEKSVQLTNNFSIVFVMAFFFNAELVIRVFFGADWLELVPILRIVSLYLVFNVSNRLLDCFLRSMALVRQFFNIRVASFLYTVLFLAIGVHWDIVGVAVAMLVVTFITNLIKLIYICHKLNYPFGKILKLIFISWRSSLVLLVEGVLFMLLIPKTLLACIVFFVIFLLTFLVLFLLFPSVVGHNYRDIVYPMMFRDKVHKS